MEVLVAIGEKPKISTVFPIFRENYRENGKFPNLTFFASNHFPQVSFETFFRKVNRFPDIGEKLFFSSKNFQSPN